MAFFCDGRAEHSPNQCLQQRKLPSCRCHSPAQTPACGLPNPLGPRPCPPTPTPCLPAATGLVRGRPTTRRPAARRPLSPASSPVLNAQCTCILHAISSHLLLRALASLLALRPRWSCLGISFFFFFDCAASLALPCPALPWPPLRLRLEPFLVAIDGPVCACAVLRLWVTLTPTRCPRAFVRQVAALPAPAPQRRPVAAGHSTHLAPDPSTRRPLPLPPGPPAVVIVAPSQQATARALKPLRLPRNPPAQ